MTAPTPPVALKACPLTPEQMQAGCEALDQLVSSEEDETIVQAIADAVWPRAADEDRNRLIERMDEQLAEWDEAEPRADWWAHQRDYAKARDLLVRTTPDAAAMRSGVYVASRASVPERSAMWQYGAKYVRERIADDIRALPLASTEAGIGAGEGGDFDARAAHDAGPEWLVAAKARRAKKDASGQAYVEGSIYEGMQASVSQHGRTIAHVPLYGDALAIVAALAASPLRETGCTMGVGCDEAGVCYAAAHGQPDQCPKPPAALDEHRAREVIDFPSGAIENGREFLRRLGDYDCTAGAISMSVDYIEAVRCFEHLAETCAALATSPRAAGDRLLKVTDNLGYITLHEPNEEGNPGDLVASVWRDDWLDRLMGDGA